MTIVFIWNEAASSPSLMPTDEPAADLISAALSAPSLPCEPSESSLAIEDVRLRDASDGVGHSASTLSDAVPNMSEKRPAYSGK